MKKGFTLIELLVVVLIIGILSAIALPQYNKAVTKARFAEVLPNLKAIGEAQQVCTLEKGSACSFNEMAITPPGEFRGDSEYDTYTENFDYMAGGIDVNGNAMWGYALYLKEDVCICYLQTGEFVFSQDDTGSCFGAPTINYATILPIREVPYDECGCC